MVHGVRRVQIHLVLVPRQVRTPIPTAEVRHGEAVRRGSPRVRPRTIVRLVVSVVIFVAVVIVPSGRSTAAGTPCPPPAFVRRRAEMSPEGAYPADVLVTAIVVVGGGRRAEDIVPPVARPPFPPMLANADDDAPAPSPVVVRRRERDPRPLTAQYRTMTGSYRPRSYFPHPPERALQFRRGDIRVPIRYAQVPRVSVVVDDFAPDGRWMGGGYHRSQTAYRFDPPPRIVIAIVVVALATTTMTTVDVTTVE